MIGGGGGNSSGTISSTSLYSTASALSGSGEEFLLLKGRKEGNVLFNDALNTFYLRLFGVKRMVKDHSDSEERKLAAAT